jgi:hypothetical protein
VLTAAHVVAGACAVRVRLAVEAFGFTRFKLRAGPASADPRVVVRDLEQVTGHAPVAVYLDDPPPGPPPREDPSPWEGMSGGPVLAAGRIVGVVTEHHPSEGTGRLTARRIDRAYEALARAIADPGSRGWALVRLAGAAAESGDLDRAESLARSIDDPTSQAWALTSLVTAAVGSGDLDRAEVLARTIADPENRAEALIGLARAAAQAGDLARAERLLARVLVMDMPETFWISTVARWFPSVVGNAWDILTGGVRSAWVRSALTALPLFGMDELT